MSRARHLARKRAVQALYMWNMSGADLDDLDQQFVLEHDMKKVDLKYFKELLQKIPSLHEQLDNTMVPFLDRPIEEIDPVELGIMRIGLYELIHRIDIPYRVVINEGIELTKVFGAEDGHKYVNSILDKAAQTLREPEVKAAARKRR